MSISSQPQLGAGKADVSQKLLQHCELLVQAKPVALHVWQAPVVQVPLQHCVAVVQVTPAAPHAVQLGPMNGGGEVPHRFGGVGVANGSSSQVTNPNCFMTGSMFGRPQMGLPSGSKQLG